MPLSQSKSLLSFVFSPSTYNSFVRGGPPAPYLRGLQHLVALFASLLVGPFLIYSAKEPLARMAVALAALQTTFLFLVSSMAHTHCWMTQEIYDRVFRVDYANVSLHISTSWVAIVACKSFSCNFWSYSSIWLTIYASAMIYKIIGILPKTLSLAMWTLLGPLILIAALEMPFSADELTFLGLSVLFGVAGLLCFSLEYPKMFPKIYGHHDLFHSLTLISQVIFTVCIYRMSLSGY